MIGWMQTKTILKQMKSCSACLCSIIQTLEDHWNYNINEVRRSQEKKYISGHALKSLVSVKLLVPQWLEIVQKKIAILAKQFTRLKNNLSVPFCTYTYLSVYFCTFLYFSKPFCTFLYLSVLFCTFLYFSVLFCTFLYFSVPV